MTIGLEPGGEGGGLGGAEMQQICADVEAYYGARLAKHGATPLGVDWSCQATQSLRFVQLLKVCDFSRPLSLNDVGCGYGALCAFLAVRYPDADIDYLGVDLSKAMISRARRRFASPGPRFAIGQASPRVADYSIASGIMNVNVGYPRAVWEDFVATMLGDMRRTSRVGFGVNFMSDAVAAPETTDNPQETRLYRTNPGRWISYCEDTLGCSVETFNNYGMKEFTLLLHCQEYPGGGISRH